MCWIIVLTKNQTLEKSKFQNAWRNNNDGAGFMYAKDKQLFIEKGFVDFDSFWESYKDIPEDITRIVHFRKISVGDNIADNHHPFYVNSGLGFAHNGTILGIKDYTNDEEKKFSDTYLFNEKILKPLVRRQCNLIHLSKDIQWLISRAILTDKIVFLNKYGKTIIINAEKGHWNTEKTIWTSGLSHTWEPLKQTTHYPQSTAGYSNGVNKNSPLGLNKVDDSKVIPYDTWLTNIYKAAIKSLKEENVVGA